MAEKKPSEFRFNADDQEPDEFYQEEMKDLRLEKLSHRITLISILLPCLIAVAIYFGYRDLTTRVHQGRDSGDLEVQKLSLQMEALSKKFNEKLITFSTTLSAQDKDFGSSISSKLNTINNNIEELNESIKSLNQNLKQTKGAIKKLDEAKADKKGLNTATANLKADLNSLKKEFQSLTGIRGDLESVSSQIKNLKIQFTEEMAKAAENSTKLKKEYDLAQASIATQLSEKIDKAALGVELLMFKKNQSTHSEEITRITQILDSIQNKIGDMQIDSKLNRQNDESISIKLPPAQSSKTENAGSNQNKSPSTIEDLNLQEQDLPPE
jgi:DNA repair exonuclease SbcCD ATPase subunit